MPRSSRRLVGSGEARAGPPRGRSKPTGVHTGGVVMASRFNKRRVVMLDEQTDQRLVEAADQAGLSVSLWCRALIRRELDRLEQGVSPVDEARTP